MSVNATTTVSISPSAISPVRASTLSSRGFRGCSLIFRPRSAVSTRCSLTLIRSHARSLTLIRSQARSLTLIRSQARSSHRFRRVDLADRAGEPLLHRDVPEDPQQDQYAADQQRRVVDEFPFEL